MADEAAAPQRARFWRRVFALLIDTILISFVLAVIGLILLGPTDGRIRIRSTLVYSNTCSRLNTEGLTDLGVTLPENFHPTSALRCTRSILGYAFDRTLIVDELTQSGAFSRERKLTYPTDRDGHVVEAYYMDDQWLVIFAVYIILMEWRLGRTLGKNLVRVRVRPLATDSLSLAQVLKRFVVRFSPLILVAVVFLFPSIFWIIFSSTAAIIAVGLLSASLTIAILVNFIRAVRRGEQPWHDRLANTEVVPV
jgi:uncharacterized RDD family membrane protein YckC